MIGIRCFFAAMILGAAVLGGGLWAKTAVKPEFEVASIKPAPSLADQFKNIQPLSTSISLEGPEIKIRGTHAEFAYMSLGALVRYAYGLKRYQVVGPDWMETHAFHIQARLPKGGTKEQVPEMMQSLLAERFQMLSHRATVEQPAYALIVSGDGHTLQEVAADPVEEPQNSAKPRGKGLTHTRHSDSVTIGYTHITMAQFAQELNQYVDRPVLDGTDLKGIYKLSFEISQQEFLETTRRDALKMGVQLPVYPGSSSIPESGLPQASASSGDNIFRAIRKLGLKLEPRNMPIDTLILDRIAKTPTEN